MAHFSEQFGIDYQKDFEWFDPLLEVDTRLFIDPFLLFADKSPEWTQAHDRVMDYFNSAFVMLAESGLRRNHQKYRRVLTLMEFPEPEEFGLGFTKRGKRGAGAGKGLARQVTFAMEQAIQRGVADIRHFEELGIFVERFNRDRISDVICNLLKPTFIKYTQAVCSSHQIEMHEVEVDHSVFDSDRMRWMKAKWLLPMNSQTNEPVILAPKRFLRELPTLNTEDWYDSLDTTLRDDWNLKISREMKKADILAAARQHIDSFRAWIAQKENSIPQPYDVDVDPKLYVQWQRIAREAVADSEIAPAVIASDDQMVEFVRVAMDYVRHFCESARGWELFWEIKGNKSIPEPNMQILIYGLVKAYCNAAQVSFDREVETGRGPVDFVFTGNHRIRVIMEAKKLNHGEFWGGLESQTPIYAKGLQVDRAIYLAIRNSMSRGMNKRWADLDRIAVRASKIHGIEITVERVDVMPRLPASDSHKTDYAPGTGEPDDAEP